MPFATRVMHAPITARTPAPQPARPGVLALLMGGGLLLGLPVLGLWVYGYHLGPFFAFPPTAEYVPHPGFNLVVFILHAVPLALFFLAAAAFLLLQGWRARQAPALVRRRFPVWGWWALLWTLAWWWLAWTRQPWFAALQPHTFTPLWLGYIVLMNALAYRRGGRCLLTERPRALLALAALSAAFWWYFEYLNRFVQNWSYRGTEEYSPLGYFVAASVAFATVLPAIASTTAWLLTFAALRDACGRLPRLPLPGCLLQVAALPVLLLLLAGMFFLGVYPAFTYPLVWLAPLGLLVAGAALLRRPSLASGLRHGDWRFLTAAPLAALLCGGAWEVWNVYSQSKWIYAIPFVDVAHGLHLPYLGYLHTEMPLLGFAGYVPFGWACLSVVAWVLPLADLAPQPAVAAAPGVGGVR